MAPLRYAPHENPFTLGRSWPTTGDASRFYSIASRASATTEPSPISLTLSEEAGLFLDSRSVHYLETVV